MKSILMALFFLLLPMLGYTQVPKTDKEAQTEVRKLQNFIGNWEGTGWARGQNGQKHLLEKTEKVQFKIDSVALLVESLIKNESNTLENSLAVITYNTENGNYNIMAEDASGLGEDIRAEVKDGKFYWYPREDIRCISQINSKGQLYETAEMKQGPSWVQIWEITLDKVSP